MIVAIRRLFASLFGRPTPRPVDADGCKCRCDGRRELCKSRLDKVKRD